MNELLNLAWQDILSFLFVFVRVGTIFALVPFFGSEVIARRITAIIAFFLSLVLVPVVPAAEIAMEGLNVITLIVFLIHELLIGLCLGLAVNVIFAGVQIAGEIAGFQMGFAIVNIVDPITGVDAPVTSNLLYIVAFLLFLSFGGHHMLIKALVDSYYIIPLEAGFPDQKYHLAVLSYGARMFLLGVKMAAPVIGVLLLLNISFALTARAIPQMNVFLMSFPLTIAIGLFFMIVIIKMMPPFMSSAIGDALTFVKSTMPLF
ncbi:MAG: flagellar biosynthetic protein FliR [Desulfomonilia bacterium]|jgi:flagellar biosynthetic protein FliR|uniref:Flagellar biosynthetic protein FliR n=1 Tax=anaerobic digester metagenome TaxID=1263854 RepID=A0A485LWX8_9ZZZZ|nr:flagellar biosynthetic protein FliR [Pseudomonadota bacterium]HON37774.1 flagellar biosynthetic protein FliR [Deltaproteobacteria bacterium]HRS55665.1 flagellar biosynthetic protein FliR [Desulfomonilia bacterium]HPD20860.1 flagellar biosynthetic protein FliR [Deltaproteobacteria bacterium]HPX19054.1 flagellar biosynthetic protein FliR [Deltaproteobacteria bacterium]